MSEVSAHHDLATGGVQWSVNCTADDKCDKHGTQLRAEMDASALARADRLSSSAHAQSVAGNHHSGADDTAALEKEPAVADTEQQGSVCVQLPLPWAPQVLMAADGVQIIPDEVPCLQSRPCSMHGEVQEE